MLQNEKKHITWETFLTHEKSNPEFNFEFDGENISIRNVVSIEHGEVEENIRGILRQFFRNTKCKVRGSNVAINYNNSKQLIPDIFITCDNNINDGKYCGVPLIVVEILSTNYDYDTKYKKNVYEELGVLEYIIVNPYYLEVLVHVYDAEEKKYTINQLYSEEFHFKSTVFNELTLKSEDIFEGLIFNENKQVKSLKPNNVRNLGDYR